MDDDAASKVSRSEQTLVLVIMALYLIEREEMVNGVGYQYNRFVDAIMKVCKETAKFDTTVYKAVMHQPSQAVTSDHNVLMGIQSFPPKPTNTSNFKATYE